MAGREKQDAVDIWLAGVRHVRGDSVTAAALCRRGLSGVSNVLAVGKASSAMVAGAVPFLSSRANGLLVTKYGHVHPEIDHPGIEMIEAGHPIPDCNSLRAGDRAVSFVRAVPENEELVMLVSGGASALMECLPGRMGLEELQQINTVLISEGYAIDEINRVRTRVSTIKGGKLLSHFKGERVYVYAISDVPSDNIEVIGSGIGARRSWRSDGPVLPEAIQSRIDRSPALQGPPCRVPAHRYHCEIVASNDTARKAAREFAEQAGFHVVKNALALNREIGCAAKRMGRELREGKPGVYLWGGEPTVVLPDNPGIGGRNQHLALLLAREISGCGNIVILCAGTDGTDGATDAAGGMVDGQTFTSRAGAQEALSGADAGSFLREAGGLYAPGPTGTNVMDLVVAIKR